MMVEQSPWAYRLRQLQSLISITNSGDFLAWAALLMWSNSRFWYTLRGWTAPLIYAYDGSPTFFTSRLKSIDLDLPRLGPRTSDH